MLIFNMALIRNMLSLFVRLAWKHYLFPWLCLADGKVRNMDALDVFAASCQPDAQSFLTYARESVLKSHVTSQMCTNHKGMSD